MRPASTRGAVFCLVVYKKHSTYGESDMQAIFLNLSDDACPACPERPSTPGAWRLTLRVTGEAPVRPERSEAKSKEGICIFLLLSLPFLLLSSSTLVLDIFNRGSKSRIQCRSLLPLHSYLRLRTPQIPEWSFPIMNRMDNVRCDRIYPYRTIDKTANKKNNKKEIQRG